METKANHLFIGAFVLALILAGLGFIRWTVDPDMGASTATYRVVFEGSVAGLAPGSNVLFNGIKVGTVETIAINAEDSRKVDVVLTIRPSTPVRTDSLASITQVGITGLSAIQISAGEPAAALLVANNADEPVQINARPALSGSVMDAMPEVLANVNALLVNVNKLVSSNEDTLNESLKSFSSFTKTLDESKGEITGALTNIRQITESFRSSAEQLDAMMKKVDSDMLNGNESIVVQAKDAMIAIRKVAEKLDQTIGGNAEQLAVVAKRSMLEFEQLAKDGRRTTRNLDRILERLDRNPQSLLFGDNTLTPYKPQ